MGEERIELAGKARKKLKPAKRGDKYDVKRSRFDVADPNSGNADMHLYRTGLPLDGRKLAEHAKPEHVAIDDYVPMVNSASRWDVERTLRFLARDGGKFLPDEDSGIDGPPLLVRVGEKLHPVRRREDGMIGPPSSSGCS